MLFDTTLYDFSPIRWTPFNRLIPSFAGSMGKGAFID